MRITYFTQVGVQRFKVATMFCVINEAHSAIFNVLMNTASSDVKLCLQHIATAGETILHPNVDK
jgi:hypothetical protein